MTRGGQVPGILMKHAHIGMSLAKLLAATLLGTVLAYGQQYGSTPAWAKGLKTPASNPVDGSKVAMGKSLFFENRLSVDGWISCSSCHDPMHAFSDPRRLSVGVSGQRGKRHAPSLL